MPHLRPRYLQARISKSLKYSPVVGILGQRQVGKTTLLEQNSAEYITLDRESQRLLADADSELFLQGRRHPFGIDEAQLSEKLYPALKEYVRKHRSPGQFLMTGSVRFTSRKAIRESLTGRIVSLDLLPFTVREAKGKPLSNILCTLILSKNEKGLVHALSQSTLDAKDFTYYLETGGLPGICFFREPSIREEKFEAHLDTILNRDLRLIYPTTILYPNLRRLLVFLARNQGVPLRLVEASREAQISTVTLPKILFAFEALFLIRAVEVQGIHRTAYFLEDQGMATWLSGSQKEESNLLRGLYANLRAEIEYQPERRGQIFQWRTRNGAEMPLVFKTSEGTIGIFPTPDRSPAPKILGSAKSFLRQFPRAKVVIACGDSEFRWKNESLAFLPYFLLV